MSSAQRIVAVYRVRCAAAAIEARAQSIAVEQSVEMPVSAIRDEWIRDEIVARVEAIEPDEGADDRPADSATCWRVTLSLDPRTIGTDAGQLMNMLFGNSSLQPDLELVDARLPAALLDALPGPAFGIAGMRELVGAPRRALTCTALKPQGLAPEDLAGLAHTFALAGIDVIKDDHGLADQSAAPFADRVRAVQRALDRSRRANGRRSLYAPSLTGSHDAIRAQMRIARECGVGAFMVAPMVSGVAALALVAREAGVPVLAHPALSGVARIAPPLLLGKLFRLFGADATIFPNAGGRFSYSGATCVAIAEAARAPWAGVAPCLPVPAGGMNVERVPEMRATFGADTMLLIGGSLLVAGDALAQRCAEFVAAVRAPETVR